MNGNLSEAALGAGAQLRAAREAGGLSIADVAAKLKLASRQVEAIESEDWQALPEATFTRGFVRGYARLVGIEESALRLDAVRPAAHADLTPPRAAMGEVTYDGYAVRPNIARWLIPLALLAVLIAGATWFTLHEFPMQTATVATKSNALPDPSKSNDSTTASDLSSASSNSPPTLLQPITPIAAIQSSVPSILNPPPLSARAPLPVPGNEVAAAAANASAAQPANAAPATTLPSISPVAPATVSPPALAPLLDGKKRIVLTYTGLSWTEVRSKGAVVFSERVDSGSREVTAAPPLSFVIGNADSVSITVDGKPYDFSNSRRDAVARFRIE
jgi:cytoskeleton protein RodZ